MSHSFSNAILGTTQIKNIAIVSATTTNANDSIKITSTNGTALSASNAGSITLPNPSTQGQLVTLSLTADVTILLTGAHWGIGTTGDITGAILRVLAINDNGTLKFGVAYLGGRNTLLTTDTNATPTSVTAPEHVLCNSAVGSATNSCQEIGWFRSNFDDTGGAAEDLWANQTGVGDINTGTTADGMYQDFNTSFPTGFSAAPTTAHSRWTQYNRHIVYSYRRSSDGTSNLVTTTQTIPTKAARIEVCVGGFAVDNTTAQTTPCRVDTNAGTSVVNVYKDPAGNNWTGAGSKSANYQITYEVGPTTSFIG